MLWKCCTQYASKFGKLSSGHRTGKGQFSLQSQMKDNAKECLDYYTVALISHASKVILKLLQARLQQYVNQNFQMFMLDSEKAEKPQFKLPTSVGSSKKQDNSRKTSTSPLLTTPKPLCGSQQTGKFWKRRKYQTTWPASREISMQVKKKQNCTWNNNLVPNCERSTSRLYNVTLLI